MKVEEKMKKNKNCELSHMVRPAENLEVYKQKQNILFISGCVEHRRFKVTWASLCGCTRPSAWAYTWPSARARGSVVCMHGRVYSAECSGVCTGAWLGGVYARARGSVVCMHGRVARWCVCTAECSGVFTGAWLGGS